MTARYWSPLPDGSVRCDLCPHRCAIPAGGTGRCLARKNAGGKLLAASYGRLTGLALDPIEKKPLHRFHPGGRILSVGSYGCNLHCPFCQNHDIAATEPNTRPLPPKELAAAGLALVDQGNVGLAFTYNEPLIAPEYLLDCAKLARRQGQAVVLVTNGCINEDPLRELLHWVDALNIDLKSFSPEGYRQLGGQLEAVLRAIRLAARDCHVEVTCLIVPSFNDSAAEMEELAAWLAGVDPAIPLHVSRFFPRHRMVSAAPTPVADVYRLADIARKHLRYVYTGNC